MDCVNNMDEIVKSDFIVLDIDPHDGIEETRILEALEKNNYKGIVLLDDINLNPGMKNFWKDITEYGHWSGTGIVIFDSNRFDIKTF